MKRQLGKRVFYSFIACSIGLVFCLAMLLLEDQLSSTFVPLGAESPGFLSAAPFVCFGLFLGWLLFLLPVAIMWQPKAHWDNGWLTCLLAVVVGCILTHVETIPISPPDGNLDFSMRVAYILAGGVSARGASYCLIFLLRRHFRMVGHQAKD